MTQSKVPEITLVFWIIKILATTLGATVGDLLTKPHASGGLHLGRIASSSVIALFILSCILLMPQRGAAAGP